MRMDAALDLVTREIISVLSESLPDLSEDWWNLYVLDQLTSNQARHLHHVEPSLESLDLAAALRVLTRNFISISPKRHLARECKNFAFQVIDIRNRFAHRTTEALSKEDVYRDIDTLERFLTLLKAPAASVQAIKESKHQALRELVGDKPTTEKTDTRPVAGKNTALETEEKLLSKKEAIALCQKHSGMTLKSREVTYSNINAASGNWWFEPSVDAFGKDRFFLLNDHTKRVLYLFKVPAQTYVPPETFFYVRPDNDRCQIYVSPSDVDRFADIHPSGPQKVRFSDYLVQRIPY